MRGHMHATAPSVGVQTAGVISKTQRLVAKDEHVVAGRLPAHRQVSAQAGIARRLLLGGCWDWPQAQLNLQETTQPDPATFARNAGLLGRFSVPHALLQEWGLHPDSVLARRRQPIAATHPDQRG